MATLKRRAWDRYARRQAAQRKAAHDAMYDFAIDNAETALLLREGVRLARKHGRSAAALAATFYDRVARDEGADVPKAAMTVVANAGRMANIVEGARPKLEAGDAEGFAKACADAVANDVKRSATATIKNNARRDNAEYAWIPQGSETCAFCITLASNGWTPARRATAMGDHAEHIHPNCECEFAVRFDSEGGVAGYDPSVYEEIYDGTEGRNSQDKINAIRREQYAVNKDKINAQHRERYAALHPKEDE